jgi:hypothetical protein
VHIPRLASDVGFVGFDGPFHLAAVVSGVEGHPQAGQHEPRGFLRDAERPRQFVGANPVLAVGEQPEGREPLVEADSRILEDGADLERELGLGVLPVALVAPLRCQIGDALRPAGGAGHDAIGPANGLNGTAAVLVIREKDDRFAEGLGSAFGCHE